MHIVDELLFDASEAQLRNVLALANLPTAKMVALFKREAEMTAREAAREAHRKVVCIR